MASKIYYKWAQQEVGPIGEVSFVGQTIRLGDLKREIIQQVSGGGEDRYEFDLDVVDSEKQRPYTDETGPVPKNATVVISRIPLITQRYSRRTPAPTQTSVAVPIVVKKEERDLSLDDFQDVFTVPGRNVQGGKVNIASVPKDPIAKDELAIQHLAQDAKDVTAQRGSSRGGFNRFAAKPDSQTQGVVARPKKNIGIPKNLLTTSEDSGVQLRTDDESFNQKVKNHITSVMTMEEVEKRIPTTPGIVVPEELLCKLSGSLLKEPVRLPCCFQACSLDKIHDALITSGFICPLCKKPGINPDMLKSDKLLKDKVHAFLQEVRIRLEEADNTSILHKSNEPETSFSASNSSVKAISEHAPEPSQLPNTGPTATNASSVPSNAGISSSTFAPRPAYQPFGVPHGMQFEGRGPPFGFHPGFGPPRPGPFPPWRGPPGFGAPPQPWTMQPRPGFVPRGQWQPRGPFPPVPYGARPPPNPVERLNVSEEHEDNHQGIEEKISKLEKSSPEDESTVVEEQHKDSNLEGHATRNGVPREQEDRGRRRSRDRRDSRSDRRSSRRSKPRNEGRLKRPQSPSRGNNDAEVASVDSRAKAADVLRSDRVASRERGERRRSADRFQHAKRRQRDRSPSRSNERSRKRSQGRQGGRTSRDEREKLSRRGDGRETFPDSERGREGSRGSKESSRDYDGAAAKSSHEERRGQRPMNKESERRDSSEEQIDRKPLTSVNGAALHRPLALGEDTSKSRVADRVDSGASSSSAQRAVSREERAREEERKREQRRARFGDQLIADASKRFHQGESEPHSKGVEEADNASDSASTMSDHHKYRSKHKKRSRRDRKRN